MPAPQRRGFTRVELESYRDAIVPDLLPGSGLRLLFVGINPGLWTAAVQTHFARPGNRFYPALLKAGIIERPVDPSAGMTDEDRDYFRSRGIGITNIVRRATARADELSDAELRTGGEQLVETVGRRKAALGRQDETLGGAELWVVPNPSGLNAHETVDSLAKAYAEAARAAGVI
jgi:TDG/mug DNA glycosylase family protein